MFFSPLFQFEIFVGTNILITNMVLVASLVYCMILGTFFLLIKDYRLLPNKIQYFFEIIFVFIYNMVHEQIGKKGQSLFPIVLTIFLNILILNIVGLLPFSFAVTSHFIWSLYLSLSFCLGIFFLGLLNYQFDYLKIFLQDIPLLLYPLMTLIELASYVIRAFSLAIRLSANIMAGHILVDIISEVVALLNYCFFDLALIVFILLMALFFLEIGVACLQAYVFILLILIYLNDSVNLHLHV